MEAGEDALKIPTLLFILHVDIWSVDNINNVHSWNFKSLQTGLAGEQSTDIALQDLYLWKLCDENFTQFSLCDEGVQENCLGQL